MRLSGKGAIVVVALVLPGLLLGCGGGGRSAASDQSASTKAEYIRLGDQICEQNYSKRGQFLVEYRNRYIKSGERAPQRQLETAFVTELVPIFEEESEELNELALPKSEAAKAKRILVELEEAIHAAKANPAKSMKEGTRVFFAKVEKNAADFGFEWCGRS